MRYHCHYNEVEEGKCIVTNSNRKEMHLALRNCDTHCAHIKMGSCKM